MITVKIDPIGKRILLDLEYNLLPKHLKGLRLAWHEVGDEVVKEAKRIIRSGKRTGKVYMYKGQPYTASAEGEPPANRSGKLANSGTYDVRNWREMQVEEKAFYSGYLEDGTRNMKKRPHLIVAVRNKQQDTVNIIERSLKRTSGH